MTLLRGLAAGALGSAALDAVTYGNMALTGRPASDTPAQLALAAADRVGLDLPTSGSRPQAYGALAGAASGLGVGALTAGARAAGLRLPLPVEAVAAGAAAMAAADVPLHRLGVSDAGTWTAADWARDAGPHLVYGAVVSATLRRLEHRAPAAAPTGPAPAPRRRASRGRVLARATALGLATGCRSSLGLVPVAGATSSRVAGLAVGGFVAGELVADKVPGVPGRIELGPAAGRVALGAAGAAALARRGEQGALLPALAGAVGAAAGTLAGWVGREMASERGLTWQAAAAEDALALGLTAWAVRE